MQPNTCRWQHKNEAKANVITGRKKKEAITHSILHGSTPTLHGRQTEPQLVVLAIFRGLLCFRSAEVYPHLKLKQQTKNSIESQRTLQKNTHHHITSHHSKAEFNYEQHIPKNQSNHISPLARDATRKNETLQERKRHAM